MMNYFMTFSPQYGQVWVSHTSSSITYNINKPLKRINLEGSRGAAPAITSIRPQALLLQIYLTCVMERGFNHAALRKDPCRIRVPPQQPADVQRPGAEWGQHLSQTLWCLSALLWWNYQPLIYSKSREGQSLRVYGLLWIEYVAVVLQAAYRERQVQLYLCVLSRDSCWEENHVRNFN